MPSTIRSNWRVAVGCLLVAAVAAVTVFATLPAGTQASQAPRHIGHNASERFESLDGLSATITMTVHRNGHTNRTVRRVKLRPGTGMRWSRATSASVRGPELTVSNGTTMWLYDSDENNVTKIDTSGLSTASSTAQANHIERLFNLLNVTRPAETKTNDTPTPGVEPLPVVPAGGGAQTSVTPVAPDTDRFGVSYNGTTTVSGRKTYVLHIAPRETNGSSAFEDYAQTIYVDAEYFFPLKYHTQMTLDGDHMNMTVVYRNVTFNPGLDNSTFQFDPPENATVSETDLPAMESYESVTKLRSNVSLSVPDPDLPASFELTRATHTVGHGVKLVSLQYTNATAQIRISKSNLSVNESDDEPTVMVGDHEGSYQTIGTSRIVSWRCGDYRYSVAGSTVSKELLIRVGESIQCG